MLIINNTPQHYEQEKSPKGKKKNNLKGIISTFYTSDSGVFRAFRFFLEEHKFNQ